MDKSINEPLIELIDATTGQAWSADTVGITGVNWQVNQGDYWVVGGPADSGKSGLLATAAGLVQPLRGQHRLFGKDLSRPAGESFLSVRRRVGFVFEGGRRLFHHLTVAENIALPLRYHNNWTAQEAGPAVGRMVEWMELSPAANLTPGRISRSLRQRAGLARALALAPELLVLDNPLAGLDPPQVRWWLDLLDKLAAGHDTMALKPMTLVAAVDDFRPWRDRARQFALLKERRWMPLGGREALDRSEEPLVRELLAGERGTAGLI